MDRWISLLRMELSVPRVEFAGSPDYNPTQSYLSEKGAALMRSVPSDFCDHLATYGEAEIPVRGGKCGFRAINILSLRRERDIRHIQRELRLYWMGRLHHANDGTVTKYSVFPDDNCLLPIGYINGCHICYRCQGDPANWRVLAIRPPLTKDFGLPFGEWVYRLVQGELELPAEGANSE